MADYTTYEGIVAYLKQILLSYAQSSKTAVFNDPTKQILKIDGMRTGIRVVNSHGASNYNGAWPNGNGNAEIDWEWHDAPYDRAFSADVDRIQEIQSFVQGSVPSLVGVAQEFNKAKLAEEIDSVILARYASQAGIKIVNSTAGYGITKSTIIDTLTNIAKDISNAGYDGNIMVFMSATVYSALCQALLEKNVLMNEVTIKRRITRDEIAEGYEPLEIEIRANKFDNMYIISTPDQRMAGKVLMLDGQSVGQRDGGVLPMKNSSSYYDINILAIPEDAAFCNVRHIISQMFTPANIDLADYNENIAMANEKLFGVLTLENVGVNPFGDGFRFNERCLYGGNVFEKYRDACVLVKSADGAVTVAPNNAMFVGSESDLTGAKDATDTPKFILEPANCSGTAYFGSATTASATVEASKSISIGSDGIPYVAPTVTYGSTAGTSKISVYADSNHDVKIGEITVTSTGA